MDTEFSPFEVTLCALHDKLFDRGFISFNGDGTVLISKELDINNEMINAIIELTSNLVLEDDHDHVGSFLKYHREHIFR